MLQSFEFKFEGNINVQSMTRQSGIFIGERNNAVGWSAHGKENNVIGKVGGTANVLYQNVSILNDPDYIDTPIDDRDIHVSVENDGGEKSSTLTFESVNVNNMQQNSMLSIGEGHITGMEGNEKVNNSQGSIYGNNNHLLCNHNINNDQDTIDSPIDDQDIKIINIKKNV
ncbi:hypothetical protein HPT25_04695 [Bacillus sp. BRMEA1]|uniref:hypothetical protein n=1 Tax=Neobacillus endophyticus TaxID=2738405 RepID=UPI0015657B4B|nr:hypothetical protein [Neobacillus endophyticus]NRD76789.1 hypothetical protein [Neobacillus endophyticus]